ncbi:MAG: DUF3320 domain-containing protein [Candidatus Lokiarchaeota archaeon]|nr:DUF3320 domain-containing protein [Candidatus Lokiarchaeota archaeon]
MDKLAAARLGKWKNALLDTSMVNKQLNFRPTQKTNVEIIFPDFQQAIKNFVLVGSEAEFMPVFSHKAKTSVEAEEGAPEAPIESVDSLHAAAIEKAKNKARVTKDVITNRTDDDLQLVLRHLFRSSKSFEEEKGINILYLAFGLLRWADKGAEGTTVYSPLLLTPVTLSRASVIEPFKVVPTEDETFVNPTIKEKLRADFGLALDDLPADYDAAAIDAFFSSVDEKIARRGSWGVERRAFLGTFSFSKIMMFNDLANNAGTFLDHPIVGCFASQTAYVEPPEHAIADAEWNDELPPDASFTILDSDSSQFKAIQSAKKGSSMIIHGPPGTGKSQCITNIIADCIASGKKVLFVSQKMAALEVVRKRLEERGIGRFCLDLFSHKANKTDLLTAIMRNARFTLENDQVNMHDYEDLATTRARLNDYVARLHAPVGKGGLTIYQVIGALTKLDAVQEIDAAIPAPQDITSADRARIEDAIAQIDVDKMETYFQHPWARSTIQTNEGVLFETIPEGIKSMKAAVAAQQQRVDAFNTRRICLPIKSQEDLDSYKAFFELFTSQALCIDAAALRSNFQYKYASATRALSGSYKKDKKLAESGIRVLRSSDYEFLLSALEDMAFHQAKIMRGTVSSPSEAREIKASIDEIGEAQVAIADLRTKLAALNFSSFDGGAGLWDQLADALAYWDSAVPQLEDWLDLHVARDKLLRYHVEDFYDKLRGKKLAGVDLVAAWQKTFYQQWLAHASAHILNIKNFKSSYHEALIQKFIEYDKQCIDANTIRLAKRIKEEMPALDVASSMRSSEMGILEQESRKKRNVKPIRQILSATKNITAALAPCFMMSPLSVAAYLPIEAFDQFFDVVIFDEASQVCPEDAIGAILRAKQLIVAGDEKQMPPTRFFQAELDTDADEEDVPMFESLLDECATVGLTNFLLKWHYRSRKEGLIAFSNLNFYDNNLVTFPDNGRHKAELGKPAHEPGVQFVHVPEGIYARQKNPVEARVVARAVIDHFKANPDRSLGIVAMGITQEEAIHNELEKIYKGDPSLEQLVKTQKQEPLFIKNLENVQGDERDVIFISVGYARNEAGVLHLNFGPINKSGGERRLNVAITRARYLVKVFCSFLPAEVDLKRSNSPSFHKLIHYLEYARTGDLASAVRLDASSIPVLEGPLEEDVYRALVAKGFVVDKQIGCSGYRIDLAIVNPEKASEYILGVVCDGRSYRAGETARDRDRLRQQVLEGLGWRLFHVWSPDWVNKKEEVVARIEKLVGDIKKRGAQASKRGGVVGVSSVSGLGSSVVARINAGVAPRAEAAPIPRVEAPAGDLAVPRATPAVNDAVVPLDGDAAGAGSQADPGVNATPPFGSDVGAGVGTGVGTAEDRGRDAKKPTPAASMPKYVDGAAPKKAGPAAHATGSEDEAFRKRLIQSGLCVPYKEFTSGGGNIEDFIKSAEVREQLVMRIVEVEGPIHHDLLVKRIQAYYDVKVLGKNLKDSINDTLLLVPCLDGFYYPAGSKPGGVRMCTGGAKDPRELGQIPPPELRRCIAMLVNEALSMQTDELFTKVARVFGYRLLKEVNKQLLAAQLDALDAEGLVSVTSGMVTNVRKDAWKDASFGFTAAPTASMSRGGTCKRCSLAKQKPGKNIRKGDTTYYKQPCLVCSVTDKETPEESWCKSFMAS